MKINLEKIAKTGKEVIDITAFVTGVLYSITKYKVQDMYHNFKEMRKSDWFDEY